MGNNIIIFNALRAMDKKIEQEKLETENVVKHGRQCLRTM